jgi:CubicO group peptidase (beta-lactamase class C family)
MFKFKLLANLCFAAVVASLGPLSVMGQQKIVRLDGTTISSAEADATVNRLMKEADVTGVAIGIIHNGEIVYLKGYGLRDKEKNLPLTADTIISGASLTKSAFSYLVMTLVDAGSLDLDTPIQRYLSKPLPDYPNYADLANDDRYKRITARMLLSHTAGFPNWRWFEDDRKLKIHFDPGTRYAYSGEGIDLLQFVVEAITKKPLEESMQEFVFRRFGMTRTSLVWQEKFESDSANGYDEYGRDLGPQKRTRADAAGSMKTTLRDFSLFIQGVMSGKGLSKKSWEEMFKPQVQISSKYQFPTLLPQTTEANKAIRLSYGLGWGLYWTPYGEAFFKEGHDEGWRNYAVAFLAKKDALIILSNSSNGEGIYKDLLESLQANTFTPIEWEGFTPYQNLPPRPPLKVHTEIKLPPSLLDLYVGKYGEPGVVLEIRREGDHLSVQENDEPKQDIFAESQSDFFSKQTDDTITFQFDSETHAVRMILHVNGKDILIRRLEK